MQKCTSAHAVTQVGLDAAGVDDLPFLLVLLSAPSLFDALAKLAVFFLFFFPLLRGAPHPSLFSLVSFLCCVSPLLSVWPPFIPFSACLLHFSMAVPPLSFPLFSLFSFSFFCSVQGLRPCVSLCVSASHHRPTPSARHSVFPSALFVRASVETTALSQRNRHALTPLRRHSLVHSPLPSFPHPRLTEAAKRKRHRQRESIKTSTAARLASALAPSPLFFLWSSNCRPTPFFCLRVFLLRCCFCVRHGSFSFVTSPSPLSLVAAF